MVDSKDMYGVMMFLVQVVQSWLLDMEGSSNMKSTLVCWYVVALGTRTLEPLEVAPSVLGVV